MPQFSPLGLEIGGIVQAGIHDERHALFHLYSIATKTGDLARIVCDEAQPVNAQIAEDLSANSVIAQIGGEAESLVGFHGVETAILQAVGAKLVDQSDAATFLAEVDDNALSGCFDHAQGGLELGPAVATE